MEENLTVSRENIVLKKEQPKTQAFQCTGSVIISQDTMAKFDKDVRLYGPIGDIMKAKGMSSNVNYPTGIIAGVALNNAQAGEVVHLIPRGCFITNDGGKVLYE